VHAPTIWRLFEVIARRGSEIVVERAVGASTTRIQASRLFALTTVLIIIHARNTLVNAFQKMFGIWLFANSAAYGMYRVLCRMGLSVSYTTVLRSLRILSKHSTRDVYDVANTSNFIVVYDNINRTCYMYSTESPDRSKLLSGTASTLYLTRMVIRYGSFRS